MAEGNATSEMLSLESVRKSLIRLEDTIIFNLIERAKYPINSPLYNRSPDSSCSLFEFFVKESEAAQAKIGRYLSPEEHAFFPENLPPPVVAGPNQPPVLYPAGASININKKILDVYLKQVLPLFAVEGDDGNYACTVTCDLEILQALSRRIHLGKFVAEIKFRDAPNDYTPAICAQNRDALMELLTFKSVEDMIKKRVEKKTRVFAQEVDISDNGKDNDKSNYKIDPLAVIRLYEEWVMPLTKDVEVEYLLRRLD